LYKMRADA